MHIIAYVEQHDPNIQSRVRRRYLREHGALTASGFEELCFYSERLGAFSAIRYMPMTILMMLNGEVLGGHGRFDAGGSYLLMRHRRPATIALVLGLGIKLYSGFTDGTVLISANFDSCLQPDGNRRIVKYASKLPLDETWTRHQRRVDEITGAGSQIVQTLDFDRYVEMSRREDGAASCAPPAPRECMSLSE
jgi:hypothetical protein